jgi:hypothetical protein
MRPRDDVDRHDLADVPGSRSARIGGRFHRTYVTSDHHGHETCSDLFGADQVDVGCFDHRICGLNRAN